MNERLISQFVHGEHSPARDSSVEAQSADAAIARKSSSVRDLCIGLLDLLRTVPATQTLALQLEHIAPQLERHIALQRKVKKWDFGEEFDAIGAWKS